MLDKMSILTIPTNVRREASTSKRPFFESNHNTHSARQLRDLLICPTQAHHVQTVSGHGIDAHVFGHYTMRLMDTPTSFLPNCLVSGCGYVAMGGGAADLLIRSADIHSRWELKIVTGQSIVNSVHFYQSSPRSNPNLLVCNNDQTITQYDLSTVSTIQEAASDSLSADPAHRPTPQISNLRSRESNRIRRNGDMLTDRPTSTGDEKPLLTHKSSIILPVPVNHCSVSPDLRSMVAVGDSNEVFIYDCRNTRQSNEPLITDWRLDSRKITLPGVSSNVGSFSTSWNQHGDQFAVASEGEVVVVYDMKMLGRPLLVKHTAQKGRPGGARVVKFSPAGPNELLAFTEHQSLVHVLDARTFDPDHEEILTVPTPLPGLTPFPPRFSPSARHIPAPSVSNRASLDEESSRDNSTTDDATRRASELSTEDERGARSSDFGAMTVDADEQADEQEVASLRRLSDDSDVFGALAQSTSPEPLLVDRMWMEIHDRSDDHPLSGLTNRSTQVMATGSRGSRVQRGYSWALRSGLTNVDDDEAYIEGEGEQISRRPRSINASSSRSASLGRPRIGWDAATASDSPSSSAPTNRQMPLHGSSIRVLSLENERRTSPAQTSESNLAVIPSTRPNRSNLVHHRAPNSSSIANIHSQLTLQRLGRNPPTLSQTEAWFDLEFSGTSGSHTNSGVGASGAIRNASPLYGLISSSYSGVRSGMWDDLIGLSWSPDGDWLVSGTEVGLVEWKVKSSSRSGFGDSRLC